MSSHIKGITVKARSQHGKEKIGIGIHKETFLNFLNSVDSEWIDIDLIKHQTPAPNGYTHMAIKRDKNG